MTATQPFPSKAPAPDIIASTPIVNESTRQQLIDKARSLGPLIREHSELSEKERRVATPVQEALSRAGFQKLFLPKSLGGFEADPVTCALVVEELAMHDSAAAWSLQSGNVNAWWASKMSEQCVIDLYTDPTSYVAAAFHPPQHAVEVEGGYRVSGRAPLASNVHDSAFIVLSAMIFENGAPRMTEFGPAIIGVVLKTSDVKILDTWHTLGMRGTDSNDVAYDNVFLPAHMSFPLVPGLPPGKHFGGPLYRFPAIPIISLFSAAVNMTSARKSIAAFRELAIQKVPMGTMKTVRDRGTVQTALAEAEALLRSARSFFYDTLSEGWERTLAAGEHTMEHRADLLLAGINASRSAARVAEQMHLLAGTSSVYETSALDRYFRDIHTLRHHGFASESKLETVGQVYLGLQPDFFMMPF